MSTAGPTTAGLDTVAVHTHEAENTVTAMRMIALVAVPETVICAALTPAIATFLHVGYARRDVLFNMDVDLTEVKPPTASELSRIEEAGVSVRRGTIADADALAHHTATHWSEVWGRETQIALQRSPPSIFLAFADNEMIGFAAHGVTRALHFGPLGTVPQWRRIGLGGVLTRMALVDMAASGHRSGEIAWVNLDAIPFYSRCSNARLGRTFWTMTRKGADAGQHPLP